jgi:hypothetical protein
MYIAIAIYILFGLYLAIFTIDWIKDNILFYTFDNNLKKRVRPVWHKLIFVLAALITSVAWPIIFIIALIFNMLHELFISIWNA